MTPDPTAMAPVPVEPPAERAVPVLTSADLLQGAREVTILHAGEAYRLRVTSKDRLILTK
jgi:hemin uptake protein HemP